MSYNKENGTSRQKLGQRDEFFRKTSFSVFVQLQICMHVNLSMPLTGSLLSVTSDESCYQSLEMRVVINHFR